MQIPLFTKSTVQQQSDSDGRRTPLRLPKATPPLPSLTPEWETRASSCRRYHPLPVLMKSRFDVDEAPAAYGVSVCA